MKGGCEFCQSRRHTSAGHGTHCFTHGERRRNTAEPERRAARKVRRARARLAARVSGFEATTKRIPLSPAGSAARRPGSLKP